MPILGATAGWSRGGTRMRIQAILMAIAVAVTATWASPTIAAERLEAIVADYDRVASQTDGDNPAGWPDVSLAAVAQRTTAYRSLQSRLTALPASRRDSEDALTRELLGWRLAIAIEGARFDEERIPFDNGDGFFNTANYVAANTVLHVEH